MAGHRRPAPPRTEIHAVIHCVIPRTHRWADFAAWTQRNTTRVGSAGYLDPEDSILWSWQPRSALARPAAAGTAPRALAPQQACQAGPHGTRDVLITPARALGSWLAAIRLRVGDHLFAVNDTEASWRRWQVVKVHGGLGRHYRDPLFDTLRLLGRPLSKAARGGGQPSTDPAPAGLPPGAPGSAG